MTDNERYVLESYPNARCVWHSDHGHFKVYYGVGECRIALSRGATSEGAAWADAADTLRSKSPQESEAVG